MSRFLLPLSEYNRIHQVAHGVLKDVSRPEVFCTFFSAFGALVLNKYYNIPARAVGGAFALCTGRTIDKPNIAFFGQMDDGRLISSPDGYHMWVQTQTHIIDFMAPIYSESFAQVNPGITLPRKMLQRAITTEIPSPNQLEKSGDFITLPDPELTTDRIDKFFDRASAVDLLKVADAWYGSRLSKQKSTFVMGDNRGEVVHLSLPHTAANGSW